MLLAQKGCSDALKTVAEQDEASLKCPETSAWWPQEVEGEGGDNSGCQLLQETPLGAYQGIDLFEGIHLSQ